MDIVARINTSLETSLKYATANGCPPKLAEAVQYAVFPGGARVRPRLCLAVALACGDRNPELSDATAASIELLHCASLVHDDLPAFDDADMRRGRASVHVKFGDELAILVGDALIVMGFESIGRMGHAHPDRLGPLVTTLGRAVGMPYGLVAGQAWESEAEIDLRQYQRAKTASLFNCAISAGAIAANSDPVIWAGLGDALGEAYQIADDLYDAFGDIDVGGKPALQDGVNNRPNVVMELGFKGAIHRLEEHVELAIDAVPDCAGRDRLQALIRNEAQRLMPQELRANVA